MHGVFTAKPPGRQGGCIIAPGIVPPFFPWRLGGLAVLSLRPLFKSAPPSAGNGPKSRVWHRGGGSTGTQGGSARLADLFRRFAERLKNTGNPAETVA